MQERSSSKPRADLVVIPPDGGWGWFVVCIAFVWNIFVDGTVYTFGLFLEDFTRDFGVQTSILSVASSVQLSLYFILGPLVAAMINRLGFRVVGGIGGVLAFAGVLGTAYVTNIYFFIGTFGVTLGIAFSMTYLSNVLIVGFYFSTRRAIATCIAVTGSAVGVSITPIVFSMLLADWDWRLKYKCLSGAHLLMGFIAIFAYKPIQPREVITEKEEYDYDSSAIWDEYEYVTLRNYDYPTNADVLQDQKYTIADPNDLSSHVDSRTSMRSKQPTNRYLSMQSIAESVRSEMPRYRKQACCGCVCNCRYVACPCLWHDHRPMYRDDILYNGSTVRLPQYKKGTRTPEADMQYHMSVTRTSHISDLPQNANICDCCPASVRRVLATMLDMTLLKSTAFLFLAFSGFFTYIGLYAPYVFGIQLSVASGIPHDHATYILTAIGISNACGRIISGVMTLIPKLSALIISSLTLILAGIAVVAHPFFSQFSWHLTFAAIFGFNTASLSSLRTVVVVDLFGLEKLTNAFGIIVLMEGISSLVALPINSFLYELSGSFILPWAFSGSMIIFSGLILIPVPYLKKWDSSRRLRKAMGMGRR